MVAAVAASAIGAYYYLRVLVVMFMTQSTGPTGHIRSPWLVAAIGTCAVLTLAVGLHPARWFDPIAAAMRSFLG